MLKRIRSFFPTKVLGNEKGFTLIELIISVILLTIVGLIVAAIIGITHPNYKGTAYFEKNGHKYYNLVHLPEKGIIGGVCAGIAYKFGIEPWIPRLGFVVFTCAGGAGIFAYLIIWAFTDSAHAPDNYLERTSGG